LKIVLGFAGVTTPGNGFRVRGWTAGPIGAPASTGFSVSRMNVRAQRKKPDVATRLLKLGRNLPPPRMRSMLVGEVAVAPIRCEGRRG
jgi:hypothetical protein